MSGQRSFSVRFATVLLAACALVAVPSLHAAPKAPIAAPPPEAAAISAALTSLQIDALTALAKVWGFLKVHHPEVAAGKYDWDAELIRMLPLMLAVPDVEGRNEALADWIVQLGVPDRCEPCARDATDVQLAAPIDWIRDAGTWGERLSGQLQQIHRYRFAGAESRYVALTPNVGHPIFRDLPYDASPLPDAGRRVLALVRYWNLVEYWFPYRDRIDGDWAAVLPEFIPKLLAATTRASYEHVLFALVTRVGDAHANLWELRGSLPPQGSCRLPLDIRMAEGRAVVVSVADPHLPVRVGDVVEAVDGRAVSVLFAEWAPYYSASNEVGRAFDMAYSLPRGRCGPTVLAVSRADGRHRLRLTRTTAAEPAPRVGDRPGDSYQRLSADIAYLKLSTISAKDIDSYLAHAEGTRGLVIDIRNYPSDFVVFALGNRLVSRTTPFVRFTRPDLANPGAFVWTEPVVLEPVGRTYAGRIAILVNEISMSQAEYTAMAFRAVPGAVVVGSTTAGADGNASRLVLPGAVRSSFSGIGVFYPDRTPTQRVGIVPDVVVSPTIEGIRAGRDEVLEAALRLLEAAPR